MKEAEFVEKQHIRMAVNNTVFTQQTVQDGKKNYMNFAGANLCI